MIYLILTLLVYQAETKYFLTEHKEGPVKHHHLVKIEEPPANKPEKKDEPKTGEGSSIIDSQVRSDLVWQYLMKKRSP